MNVFQQRMDITDFSIVPFKGSKKKKSTKPEIDDTKHLVVLVHGYGAHPVALACVEQTMFYYYPHLYILNSRENRNTETKSLEEMGRALASEVNQHIQKLKWKNSDFYLSFIGHSMGGLAIRASLEHLKAHRESMKLFMSLSSPHLGHLIHNSHLTKFGMWAISTLAGSKSIRNLLLSDEK